MTDPVIHTAATATPRTRYVALDLETTTLDRRIAFPLEVAAVEFDPLDSGVYGDVLTFVPHHRPEVLHAADPEALSVNRYYERRLYADRLNIADTRAAAEHLVSMLTDATLVCANPSYDSIILWAWLSTVMPELEREPWRHRHYDVSLATAIELGLDRIPGLSKCAELWDLDCHPASVDTGRWHTAAFDAFATADVCSAVTRATRARRDA